MSTTRVQAAHNEGKRLWTNGFERERAVQLIMRMDHLWDEAEVWAGSSGIGIKGKKGDQRLFARLTAWECENMLPDELENMILEHIDAG